MRPPDGPMLVVDVPAGRVSHPVLPGVDVRTIIARLAPVIPAGSTWHVNPGTDA